MRAAERHGERDVAQAAVVNRKRWPRRGEREGEGAVEATTSVRNCKSGETRSCEELPIGRRVRIPVILPVPFIRQPERIGTQFPEALETAEEGRQQRQEHDAGHDREHGEPVDRPERHRRGALRRRRGRPAPDSRKAWLCGSVNRHA